MAATAFDQSLAQFTRQVEKLTALLTVTTAAACPSFESKDALESLYAAAVVFTSAHLEQYLRRVVGTAAHLGPDRFRAYVSRHGSQSEKPHAATCSKADLNRYAENQVSFANGARKLRRVFVDLLGFEPWPNEEVGALIRDLHQARSCLLHTGDTFIETYYREFETPGWVNRRYKGLPLMEFAWLDQQFPLRRALAAANECVQFHALHFQSDDRWRIRDVLARTD